jgi:alanyl-tRNA synthetase
MTSRLYYHDPRCCEFEARVLDVVPDDGPGRLRVLLDRSAFYPTTGGQPFDTGRLGDARVVDVVEDDDGRVAHVVEGTVSTGDLVRGVIDWPRRLDHMQQHTGQHVLSAAFERLHAARTASFHLGADASTIDLDKDVSAAQIAAAERLASDVVWEDRPVAIRFVTDEEASRLPLRKPPVKTGTLRLIEVADFDLSACGGTHVSRTGEVGVVAVKGWERYKGGTRIEFVCGGRALESYRVFRDAVVGSVRALSVFPHELPDGIARLQGANKDAQREIKRLRETLAGYEGASWRQRAEVFGTLRAAVAAVEGHDGASIKSLAAAAADAEGHVAVFFGSDRPSTVAAAAHASVSSMDCGALVRDLCARFGGKGGGKPGVAQGGGLDASSDDLVAFARDWLAHR